jgi:dethiobiotin synthetase
MRFGKTFTAYQLAKKLGAKRVLVVTFKPAVEDAWRTDMESHVDFDGWQYLSRSSGSDPTQTDDDKPVVYFGSFQDLLGRDAAGNISCSKVRTTRSPRRRASSSTPPTSRWSTRI